MSELLEFEVKDGSLTYTAYVYEGDASELISCGVNRKYTHHIVEMVRLLRDDRSFRHLSMPQICEAVSKYGANRPPSWHMQIGEVARIMARKDENEYDPERTIKSVSINCGASCWLCGSVIIKDLRDDAYSVEYNGYNGVSLAALFNQPYDIVCVDCIKITRPGGGWGKYELINGLHALLNYLNHAINKIDPPKKHKRKQ